MKNIAIVALALATLLPASPAFSQVYLEYGIGPGYNYDRPLPRYYRYPPAYAYGDYYEGRRYRYGQRCWTERRYGYRHHHRVLVRQTVCD